MSKENELISCAMYWGTYESESTDLKTKKEDEASVIKNQLILTSWDKEMYLFDDDDAESRTGE